MVVHFTLQEAFGVDLEQLGDAHVRPSRGSPRGALFLDKLALAMACTR